MISLLLLSSFRSTCFAQDDTPSAKSRDVAWGLEGGLGWSSARNSAYIDRLAVFGFGDDTKSPGLQAHVAIDRRFRRYFAVGIDYAHLESYSFKRDQEFSDAKLVPGSFEWDTTALSLYVRAGLPLVPELYPFVQVSGGALWSSTHLRLDGASANDETDSAPLGSIGVGVQVMSPYVGVSLAAGYSLAGALENRIGDAHSRSGTYVMLSLRVQTLEGDL